MVKAPYSAIVILQGDEITLSCMPSQSDIVLQWSYNGSDISSSSYYRFNPPMLNHDLTIPHAGDTDSGFYTCTFKSRNKVLEDTISLTVVPSKCKCNNICPICYIVIEFLFFLLTSLLERFF